MKFSASTTTFRAAVQKAAPLAKGEKVPILGNLLLQSNGKEISITASNGEQTIIITTPALSEKPFDAITLPAARLSEIASKANGTTILLEAGGNNRATIKSGKGTWDVPGLPASDYIELPDMSGAVAWTLAGDQLRFHLDRVERAQSTDDTRQHIQSVLLSVHGGTAEFIATSGLALARWEAELDGPNGKVIIPSPFVRLLLKNLSGEQPATLSANGQFVALESSSVRLYGKLMESDYVNYKAMLTAKYGHEANFDRLELLDLLSRAMAAGRDEHKSIRPTVSLADGELTVSLNHLQGGYSEAMPCKTEEAFTSRFNADVLSRLLTGCNSDQVKMEWKDEASPVQFSAGNWTGVCTIIRSTP